MEIQTLRMLLAEQDVNQVLKDHLPKEYAIENPRVRISAEGVLFAGEYPTVFVKVPFETLWELAVVNGLLLAKLAAIKVSGVPASMFRGVLMDVIQEAVAREAGVHLEDEIIHINIVEAARARKVPLRMTLKSVQHSAGVLVIEAGD
jgi:hypothetical protein